MKVIFNTVICILLHFKSKFLLFTLNTMLIVMCTCLSILLQSIYKLAFLNSHKFMKLF